ncbi:hypothetical protein [Roseivirga pacifica]|uniref:hypothetical protein n=1 Tax=Roseivirga pacifica TaxID=1267423 RepID=UPI0020954A33|nr:hypothetical protein [Roseivirga pacifica]MCO6360749.1 hypothetical protein [Roseivirga pacifica]MCO6368638.1 hypothetical protein [Roseivirga pacifica]MCO6372781.1 hypothetical protein [Roseivirga pacifica]MCO6376839.1 hypothetical protein [Roseivirga pacifica]MCO6377882.1 hypothetical protein [Roseivirga pacifica]
MEISTLTIKLIILLVPGALATILFRSLIVRHKEQSSFMFIITAIIFGLFSYLFLQLLLSLKLLIVRKIFGLCNSDQLLETFQNLSDSNSIPYEEVLLASAISISLGLMIAKFDNLKILNRIAQKFNISNKYGEENLFSFFLNSPDISWVYVRDIKNSLTYFGSVYSFSETSDIREIVLEEVSVFSYPDSKELYEIDRIYLSLNKNDIIIEQANLRQ